MVLAVVYIYTHRVICRLDLELCIHLYSHLGLCSSRDLEPLHSFFSALCDKFEYLWHTKMLLRGKTNSECKLVIKLQLYISDNA